MRKRSSGSNTTPWRAQNSRSRLNITIKLQSPYVRNIPRSLLLIPLPGALPPVFLNGVQALGAANEFRAIGMDELTKEESVRFRVRRIARYGHSLAGFDGISRPSDVR